MLAFREKEISMGYWYTRLSWDTLLCSLSTFSRATANLDESQVQMTPGRNLDWLLIYPLLLVCLHVCYTVHHKSQAVIVYDKERNLVSVQLLTTCSVFFWSVTFFSI